MSADYLNPRSAWNLNPRIINRVETYQKHFSYASPVDFVSALTHDQRDKYTKFTELIAGFRKELTTFDLFAASVTDEEFYDDDSSEMGEY